MPTPPDPFQPGDVVELKSGGGKMTVGYREAAKQVPPGQPTEYYKCYWHDPAGQPQEGAYPEAVLKKST